MADRHRGAGGAIAFASWTAEGFTGGLLRLVGRYAPPPAGLRAPERTASGHGREPGPNIAVASEYVEAVAVRAS